MNESADIAVQIVNFKTKTYLSACLASLLKDLGTSGLVWEINVLDNNSGDDLSDLEAFYRNERKISFSHHHRNGGFGAGHNMLAKKTRASFLLLINPDVEFIEPNTVRRLYDDACGNVDAAVVGPQLLTAQREPQKFDHGELSGILASFALAAGRSYWRERNERGEVAWVSGALFLIRKKIFDALSGFDENFFLYKEEEDLCLRIREQGKNILYDPTIHVLHHGSVVAKKEEYMGPSLRYFLEKHFKGTLRYPLLKLWS